MVLPLKERYTLKKASRTPVICLLLSAVHVGALGQGGSALPAILRVYERQVGRLCPNTVSHRLACAVRRPRRTPAHAGGFAIVGNRRPFRRHWLCDGCLLTARAGTRQPGGSGRMPATKQVEHPHGVSLSCPFGDGPADQGASADSALLCAPRARSVRGLRPDQPPHACA